MDKSGTISQLKDLINGQNGLLLPSPKETQGKHSVSFYTLITDHCTCGRCYNALARTDRVPWKWCPTAKRFFNSKHGAYKPSTHCKISAHKQVTRGWLFESVPYTLKEAKAGSIIAATKIKAQDQQTKAKDQQQKEYEFEVKVDERERMRDAQRKAKGDLQDLRNARESAFQNNDLDRANDLDEEIYRFENDLKNLPMVPLERRVWRAITPLTQPEIETNTSDIKTSPPPIRPPQSSSKNTTKRQKMNNKACAPYFEEVKDPSTMSDVAYSKYIQDMRLLIQYHRTSGLDDSMSQVAHFTQTVELSKHTTTKKQQQKYYQKTKNE
jgi:hypothetical protein